ncbi:serine/threonine-protein kinase [Desnuesiella massiliensis]|uniref:serine/threonine-protein kinase n=1 Tax=Desnuesiella massiliensis TaxID=1650662 RepID=UPI0006E27131|nr:serine/threonine-protein kinase [Desnuesiella massiliensis]
MLSKGYILDDRYEVIKVLGSGGMGKVYLCKNIRLDNLWSIKEVEIDSNNNMDVLTEADILKDLDHPCIPKIVDRFYEDKKVYMVMEYIEGMTLKEYTKKNSDLDIERFCQIILKICDIISYLHGLNPPIIYMDLKPSNIIITPTEKIVLIDFGISRVNRASDTIPIVKIGSNGFAAPEQYGLGKTSEQTDIYGIGMVMYFLVRGKAASTPLEPLMDENYDINMDKDLKRIIQKAVQVEPKDRYTSVEELKDDLRGLNSKSEYEKTRVLGSMDIDSNSNSNSNSNNNDPKPKQTSKKHKMPSNVRLKKISLVFSALVIAFFSILYVTNAFNNKTEDEKILSEPEVKSKVEETTPVVIPQQPKVEPAVEPAKEAIKEDENKDKDEEKNTEWPIKGKGKYKEKKKK